MNLNWARNRLLSRADRTVLALQDPAILRALWRSTDAKAVEIRSLAATRVLKLSRWGCLVVGVLGRCK